ncbi:GFA family protein [Pseudomonas sp. Irchel s3b6]|uniref:GFA family protein n=1 Tax=Pseudomonas sp. Irchel s3b6 TaxID=2009078 RepID=UPI000BA4226F|nr:GFA family protein [Pseudomonas sp. Irchel s3b6]
MDELHHGSCLCGAVHYQLSSALKAITHCHCRRCQKAHGAAFATYGSVPGSALSLIDPTAALKAYESSPGVTRQFCGDCGASLFWRDSQGPYADWISIAIATLDTPMPPARKKHSCLDQKACWYE